MQRFVTIMLGMIFLAAAIVTGFVDKNLSAALILFFMGAGALLFSFIGHD